MLAKRVLHSKKPKETPKAPEPPKVKRVLVSAKPVPPIPDRNTYLTKTMESFEALREYYTERNQPIPQSVITWYHQELVQEKKEIDEFWARCAATKACLDGIFRGDDEKTISQAVNAARQAEKKLPILESDIGPMPAYGTGEFWAWCSKRKKLKSQKEEAMKAAGIPVPSPKKKASLQKPLPRQ